MDNRKNFAQMIDHTLLKPEATEAEIQKLCKEAMEHGFASVCVNPTYVPICARLLSGSLSRVCTVIGFPLGATSVKTKVFEAKNAYENGADEFDMVINIGALKDGMDEFIAEEIASIVKAVGGKTVKVIIETALLTEDEIVRACKQVVAGGAHFVKTSTGHSSGGATTEHVRLMRATVGKNCGVKASGGIRTYEDANRMVEAGANRIGTSAGVVIVTK